MQRYEEFGDCEIPISGYLVLDVLFLREIRYLCRINDIKIRKMKINANYKLREIAGETIIVNQGTTGTDLTRIISLNASAKLLYEKLAGQEFEVEDAARILTETYGIGAEQALTDATTWVEALKKCKVIG